MFEKKPQFIDLKDLVSIADQIPTHKPSKPVIVKVEEPIINKDEEIPFVKELEPIVTKITNEPIKIEEVIEQKVEESSKPINKSDEKLSNQTSKLSSFQLGEYPGSDIQWIY